MQAVAPLPLRAPTPIATSGRRTISKDSINAAGSSSTTKQQHKKPKSKYKQFEGKETAISVMFEKKEDDEGEPEPLLELKLAALCDIKEVDKVSRLSFCLA